MKYSSFETPAAMYEDAQAEVKRLIAALSGHDPFIQSGQLSVTLAKLGEVLTTIAHAQQREKRS